MANWKYNIQTIVLIILGIYGIYSQEQVNGEWGEWRPLTLCSAKSCNCSGDVLNVTQCENGNQVLIRHCDNPRPASGGKWCQGIPLKKTTECVNLGTCPGWCSWSEPVWLRKSTRITCLTEHDRNEGDRSNFNRYRERQCTCPKPMHEKDGEICRATAQEKVHAYNAFLEELTGNWYQEENVAGNDDREGLESLPNCLKTTTLKTTTPTTTTTTTTEKPTTTVLDDCTDEDYYNGLCGGEENGIVTNDSPVDGTTADPFASDDVTEEESLEEKDNGGGAIEITTEYYYD